MNYTTEQENIIYSDADNIFVIALAGTGKTTTLIGFSKVRKKESFLYLVYNSTLKEDVQSNQFVTTELISSYTMDKYSGKLLYFSTEVPFEFTAEQSISIKTFITF